KIAGSVHRSPIDQLAGSVDIGSREAVRGAESADCVEVLERESEGIHHAVAGVTGRIRAMGLHDLADRLGFLAFFVFLKRFDVRRWRSRRSSGDILKNVGSPKDG